MHLTYQDIGLHLDYGYKHLRPIKINMFHALHAKWSQDLQTGCFAIQNSLRCIRYLGMILLKLMRISQAFPNKALKILLPVSIRKLEVTFFCLVRVILTHQRPWKDMHGLCMASENPPLPPPEGVCMAGLCIPDLQYVKPQIKDTWIQESPYTFFRVHVNGVGGLHCPEWRYNSPIFGEPRFHKKQNHIWSSFNCHHPCPESNTKQLERTFGLKGPTPNSTSGLNSSQADQPGYPRSRDHKMGSSQMVHQHPES